MSAARMVMGSNLDQPHCRDVWVGVGGQFGPGYRGGGDALAGSKLHGERAGIGQGDGVHTLGRDSQGLQGQQGGAGDPPGVGVGLQGDGAARKAHARINEQGAGNAVFDRLFDRVPVEFINPNHAAWYLDGA